MERKMVSADYINSVVKINGTALVEQDVEIQRLKDELKKSEPQLREDIYELEHKLDSMLDSVRQFYEGLKGAYGTSNKA